MFYNPKILKNQNEKEDVSLDRLDRENITIYTLPFPSTPSFSPSTNRTKSSIVHTRNPQRLPNFKQPSRLIMPPSILSA